MKAGITGIQDTEAMPVEPHKDQEKQESAFSHSKNIFGGLCVVAQNQLEGSLTIKGENLRISKKPAEEIPVLLQNLPKTEAPSQPTPGYSHPPCWSNSTVTTEQIPVPHIPF